MSLKIRKIRGRNEWAVKVYDDATKKYVIIKRYNTKEEALKHIDDINNAEDTEIDIGNDKKSLD